MLRAQRVDVEARGARSSMTMSAPATSSSTSASPGRPITERLRRVEVPEEHAGAVAVAPSRRSTPVAVYQRQRVAVGRLDLHHVGAGVGEQLRAVRARDPGARGRRPGWSRARSSVPEDAAHVTIQPASAAVGIHPWLTPVAGCGAGAGAGAGAGEVVMSPGPRAAREPRTRAVRPIGSGTTPRARARAGRRPSGPSGTRR